VNLFGDSYAVDRSGAVLGPASTRERRTMSVHTSHIVGLVIVWLAIVAMMVIAG